MALIKCPECGKELSDAVVSCPQCGYPLIKKREYLDKTEKVHKVQSNEETNKTIRYVVKNLTCSVTTLILIGLIGAVIYFSYYFCFFIPIRTCPDCEGIGKFIVSCPSCRGTGKQTLSDIILNPRTLSKR